MSRIDYAKLAQGIEEKYKNNSTPNFLMVKAYESSIEYYRVQINNLHNEIKDLQSHLTLKESKISEQTMTIDMLSATLEKEKFNLMQASREIIKLSADLRVCLSQLNGLSDEKRIILEKLSGVMAAQSHALQQLDSANKKIENIQSELMEARKAAKDIEYQLKAMVKQKSQLQQDLENTNHQCEALKKTLNDQKKQLKLKSQRIAQLTHTNEESLRQTHEIEQECEILKGKLERSEQKNSDSSQLEELKQQLVLIRREFAKEKQKIHNEYKQKLTSRDRELNQLKVDLDTQKKLLEQQKAKNKAQQEKLLKSKEKLRSKDKQIQGLELMSTSTPYPTLPPLSENLTRFLGSKSLQPLTLDFIVHSNSYTFKQYLDQNFIAKNQDPEKRYSTQQLQNLEKDLMKKQSSRTCLLDLYLPLLKEMFYFKSKDKTLGREEKSTDTIDFMSFMKMFPAFASYILALRVAVQITDHANESQKSELVEYLQIAASPLESDEGLPPAQYALALMYDSQVSLTLVSVEPNQTKAVKYYEMAEKYGYLSSGAKGKLPGSGKDTLPTVGIQGVLSGTR